MAAEKGGLFEMTAEVTAWENTAHLQQTLVFLRLHHLNVTTNHRSKKKLTVGGNDCICINQLA